MHLLQVCNVGNIVGGTAACAWTVMRSLPSWRHTVVFLSAPTTETQAAFSDAHILHRSALRPVDIQRIKPDLVLLHNSDPSRVSAVHAVPSIMFHHSPGERTAATSDVYCSRWLADRCGQAAGRVLYQAVPLPPQSSEQDDRRLRDRLIVGRICTPVERKWPLALIPFYSALAQQFEHIDWEFVGCPGPLQTQLNNACRRRATFLEANWAARSHLWRWDALLYHHPTLVETFGRVAAESLRTGCIPVVDGRAGFIEQIVPGTGYLCDQLSEFTNALEQISQPTHRRTLSRRATTHGNEQFSLARFQRSLLQLSEDVFRVWHQESRGRD